MKKQEILIYSFYRFINIKDPKQLKKLILGNIDIKKIKGTIIIAEEGINGSFSGLKKELDQCIKLIRKQLKVRKIFLKINQSNFVPFNKMKVKIKKEIVSMGYDIFIKNNKEKFIEPSEWDNLLKDPNIKVLDTRNNYEIKIGTFRNSVPVNINKFREFPSKLESLKFNKKDKIAMFCTGGIRCEKASTLMNKKGFKNVFQLKGGILNYLKYKKDTKQMDMWDGECFVFDDRVAVNKELKKGSYLQCHGCRSPITKIETSSKLYKKGVHCEYCYHSRSSEQKRRSETRQKQINTLEKNGVNHTFKTIQLKDLISN